MCTTSLVRHACGVRRTARGVCHVAPPNHTQTRITAFIATPNAANQVYHTINASNRGIAF